MRTLAERLLGKCLANLYVAEPNKGFGVVFTDGSAFTIYSSVSASLISADDAFRVERVTDNDAALTMHLSGGGEITISADRARHGAVELYVFHDAQDGQIIVEN